MDHPVIIVGGGLAGLTAARLLHRSGVAFLLLEARDRFGGRILSVDAEGRPSDDGFDLGPSWFWPGAQPALGGLVEQLGLAVFPQADDGDVVFQRMSRETPQRYRGLHQEPQSMRFCGGTATLVAALVKELPPASLRLGALATRLSLDGQDVEVGFLQADGAEESARADHVILAMPPRLLEAGIVFSPALDPATARLWRATATWMAPHAKVFAIYDRPFWREAGLSGSAQSMVGPLVEIHDATTASGAAALFGFVGVPAERRAVLGLEALVAAAIRQLAQLFGPEAGRPCATLFKDWAADPLTAAAADRTGGEHPAPSGQPWVSGLWLRAGPRNPDMCLSYSGEHGRIWRCRRNGSAMGLTSRRRSRLRLCAGRRHRR